MRFSVIMPVCLSPYTWKKRKSAINPSPKFIRAVMSFLQQEFKDAELIIISDGCDITKRLYMDLFQDKDNIRFTQIPKQSVFSGVVRQVGIEMAQGELICYLDHDDFFGEQHLSIIHENFDTKKYGWVFFRDLLVQNAQDGNYVGVPRPVKLERSHIGTSMIAHKRSLNVVWGDGLCHDWQMIEDHLLQHTGLKIPTPAYFVCHHGNKDF